MKVGMMVIVIAALLLLLHPLLLIDIITVVTATTAVTKVGANAVHTAAGTGAQAGRAKERWGAEVGGRGLRALAPRRQGLFHPLRRRFLLLLRVRAPLVISHPRLHYHHLLRIPPPLHLPPHPIRLLHSHRQ